MTDNRKFSPGDYVVCTHKDYYGVTGRVIKKYTPTACEEQTMIETSDGRRFHAPTREFLKIGLGGKLCILNRNVPEQTTMILFRRKEQ